MSTYSTIVRKYVGKRGYFYPERAHFRVAYHLQNSESAAIREVGDDYVLIDDTGNSEACPKACYIPLAKFILGFENKHDMI